MLLAAAPGTSQPPRRRHRHRKPLRRPVRSLLAPRAVSDRPAARHPRCLLAPGASLDLGASPFKSLGPFSSSSESSLYTALSAPFPLPNPAAGTGERRAATPADWAGTPAPGPCSWARGAGKGCLLLCAEIAEEKMGLRSSGPGTAAPRPPPSLTPSVRSSPNPGDSSLLRVERPPPLG